MWLFTPIGFFSAVKKRGETCITVRARVKDDLNRLRRVGLAIGYDGFSAIVSTPKADYPFRVTCKPEAWTAVVGLLATEVDYDNFKNKVAEQQGREREGVYHQVWEVLRQLDPRTKPHKVKGRKRMTNEERSRQYQVVAGEIEFIKRQQGREGLTSTALPAEERDEI